MEQGDDRDKAIEFFVRKIEHQMYKNSDTDLLKALFSCLIELYKAQKDELKLLHSLYRFCSKLKMSDKWNELQSTIEDKESLQYLMTQEKLGKNSGPHS